jgi:hypothetical protein
VRQVGYLQRLYRDTRLTVHKISYVFTIITGLGTELVTASPTNSFGTPTQIKAFKGLHCCNFILQLNFCNIRM